MEESKNTKLNPNRLLASTLHEIRTPIQTIVSTVELLQETALNSEQKEYVRQIQFSADVLLNLANDILDFSKIGSPDFKLECIPVSISELTEQVVDTLSISAYNKGVEVITDFTPDLPLKVMGDPVRIQQVLINFIKNAVKFTSKGYIYIQLSYLNNSEVLIKVTDTGIGISDENKKKLFTDYFQADVSTYRNYGGTGLGLSIVKKIVTVMGGTVGVQDNPQGGSVFWAKLPLRRYDEYNIEQIHLTVPEYQKFLIITSNDIFTQSLVKRISNTGVKNITAANTAQISMQLLVQAERNNSPYTTIFIDMNMGDRDGWHIASDIRNNPEITSQPKLYMMVSEGQMGKDTKMKMLNWINGYLYKPIKNKMLFNLLKHMFDFKEELEELQGITEDDTPFKQPQFYNEELKVLIAEDHPVNRKLMQTFVQRLGAKVYVAEDGEQAIDVIKISPDISFIFMDIQMPVMNGVEASSILRKAGYKGVIIACTANNDTNDFEDYKRIGMNDILVKPFKKDAIKTLIDKWTSPQNTAIIQKPLASPQIDNTIWDIKDFMGTVSNDLSLATELIAEYIIQTEPSFEELDHNLASKDYNKIKQTAHRIKGSSGAISAAAASKIAGQLENAAINKDYDNTNLYIKRLRYIFSQFKKAVDIWRCSL